MNALEIVPFAGFLVLTVLILGKTILLNKRGIKVSGGNKNSNERQKICQKKVKTIGRKWR